MVRARRQPPRNRRIAFAWAQTELGRILVATTSRGICFCAIDADGAQERLVHWVGRHERGAEIVEDRRSLLPVIRQLAAYARGERRYFDVDLDLRGTEFQRRVWQAERRVPYGQTRTYSEIASAVGHPRSPRAIGNATGRNPVPLFIPCHRIVAKDGPGGFTGGLRRKHRLLALEGAARFP